MESREAVNVCSLAQALLQYRAMLFGFIFSLVRDLEAAEEIYQQTAVVALEKERKGGEVVREPAKWLKEVVRRLVQAGYRTRKGRLIAVDPAYLEQVAETFKNESGDEPQQARLAALKHCLDRVALPNREILQRRYVHGASYDIIGKEVDKTPGALRVLVHRLQKLLADCVEGRRAST